ncbi:MAG: hypothetical protein HY695_08075 [Deltaproteobacteria bacterium]|nr:hypothetical protein [Deltaproteobacteria bacterium]
MRRVVVTGVGVVSSIGNDKSQVMRSLKEGRSGIALIPDMRELGFHCQVAGVIKSLDTSRIGKRFLQNMSEVAKYGALAASEALDDAGLSREAMEKMRPGVVVGGSFGGIGEVRRAHQLLWQYKSPSRLGGRGGVKIMHSTTSANLAAWLGIQGRAYSLCSSSSSGADNIGHAYELIAYGVIDLCVCGAAEESTWRQIGVFFNNWGGMPSSWNHQPERACRPYDRDRQGTVFSEGAGILILESVEHAEKRGARPYAEIVGYGCANDGSDMFEPSGEGLSASIKQALAAAERTGVRTVDYINSHGTGTKSHDALEVRVLKEIFGASSPLVSSNKGLAGHAMGAAGALEAVFALLMLRHNFVSPTNNLENIAADCEGINHVREFIEAPLETAMTFNAGLGGTNACLIFRKL